MNVDVIVQRQLDNMRSGNGAYLEMFLQAAQEAGADTRIVFAPWRSFGNRPWAGFHSRFAALCDSVIWPRSVRIGRTYWSLSGRVWSRFAVRLLKAAWQRLGGDVTIYSYLGDPLEDAEAAIVADVCNAGDARLCVAEYSSLAPVLKRLDDGPTRGVLVHDLFSDRAARFRANGLDPDFLEVTTEKEAEWVAAADVCFYASANEMASFERHTPRAASLWLRPTPRPQSIRTDSSEPRVVFLGTQHAGNRDALCHFLDAIWPRVIDVKPNAALWIAGSIGSDPEVQRRVGQGVRCLGRVDDLSTLGGPDSIGVAPTRLATGVSIKVAEYLMLGMPSVVYPLALEGFGDALNDLVEVANDEPSFAARIVALLDSADARRALCADSARRTTERLDNRDVIDYIRDVISASMPLAATGTDTNFSTGEQS